MSIDGWKFAEQLVGITDEALRQRRKALEGKLGAHTDAVWEGVKATKEEVSNRLRDMLYPGLAQPNLDLDGCLLEVERRIGVLRTPLENIKAEAHDAALEEAVSAIPLTLPTGEYAETVERIRALKSKPAPVQCLVPGCDRPHQHEGTHTGGAPAPDGQHYGNFVHAVGRLRSEAMQSQPVAHDFGWALAQMRAGKKVRRPHWNEPEWLLWTENSVWQRDPFGRSTYRPSASDWGATDWEVAE